MNLNINALVVTDAITADAALEIVRNVDPMDFVWGFDGSPGSISEIGTEEQQSPWEDSRLIELSDLASDGTLATHWESVLTADRERFQSAVRWSAERWLEAVVRICRQEDHWFEVALATWVPLQSGGRLLLAPVNLDGFDADSVYGDLFVEGSGRYASLAAAAGIRFLDLEDLQFDVL